MGREEDGLKLFENKDYEFVGCEYGICSWKVKGSSGNWLVKYGNGIWECECPDHFYRHSRCKHIRCSMLDAKEQGIKTESPNFEYKEDENEGDIDFEEETEGIDLEDDEKDYLGMMEDPEEY